jgi:glutathione synthase/RimK-type ligase-like ATP-grasp enzyme
MPASTSLPIAVYYEHDHWFRPLFAELERRGLPYVRLHAGEHNYALDEPARYALVFNRMSPSAYLRGRGTAIFYTLHFLDHLERQGVRVVNGSRAYRLEISKAAQLSLLRHLGYPFPRTRVVHDPCHAPTAASEIGYPVVVKPNVGGSGAGVRRFDRAADLAEAAFSDSLDLGPDRTALVQELIPAEGNAITRVEVLGGEFLYGIRIYSPGNVFNLCPADVCRTAAGEELLREACPADAPDHGLVVEAYHPPQEVIEAVERIMDAAGIEVGGVEYLTDARDGRIYFYDINALSNFVADATRVVGFDPVARLVDYLEREAA